MIAPFRAEDRVLDALAEDDADDLADLDLLVAGRPRHLPAGAERIEEVFLAVEVSSSIDQGDVECALRRAALLRRSGFRSVAVVAGEGLTEGARAAAERQAVVVLQDGRVQRWPQALEASAH